MYTSKQDRDVKKKKNPEIRVNLDFTLINKYTFKRM